MKFDNLPLATMPSNAEDDADLSSRRGSTVATAASSSGGGGSSPLPPPKPAAAFPKSSSHHSRAASHSSSAHAASSSHHRGGPDSPDDNRRVCLIRGATIATLLTATILVATFAGWYVASDERSNFELQYHDAVAKVADAFRHRIDVKRETARTVGAVITSRYGNAATKAEGKDIAWPNVTIPDFQEQTAGGLSVADGRALSYNPIIHQGDERSRWEAHAAESAWILGDPALITPPPNTTWPDNRTVSFGIYSRDASRNVIYDPGYVKPSKFPNVMVPVWQIAPIAGNAKAVMFNLHSEVNRRQALDHMMEHRVPALTAILQLVQDGDRTRPSSILFYPVFDTFGSARADEEEEEGRRRMRGEGDGIASSEGGERALQQDGVFDNEAATEEQPKVVGSVSIVFSWDTLLNSVLPDYIKGVIAVLYSSTGQVYSYSITGGTVTFLGEGDHHDPSYEEYEEEVKTRLVVGGEEKGLITYGLRMYPSREFEAEYVTNRAAGYAVGVVLIFLFTACLFVLYDYLVEDRQQKTAHMARQTGNIVESMFPPAFRERLYKHSGRAAGPPPRRASYASSGGDSAGGGGGGGGGGGDASESNQDLGSSHASSHGTSLLSSAAPSVLKRKSTMGNSIGKKQAMRQIDRFMKGLRSAPSDHNVMAHVGEADDEPIAELFHNTSIMFSDIVGFTKWSSERTPNEVFQLLEMLFWDFDDIAARNNVFKLGTIGDCYIAVTGIPDPVEDHASVLTRFAFEARDKVREVFASLQHEGLDTARLDMRFGIHSGATTAGILRGTKSRFELFGDTINTASRMESTGIGGKIQVSEETAALLRRDGKARWLVRRNEMITAKGKGQMQTYWVEPQREGYRVSFSEKISNFLSSENNSDSSHSTRSCRQLSQCEEEKAEEEDIESGSFDQKCVSEVNGDEREMAPDNDVKVNATCELKEDESCEISCDGKEKMRDEDDIESGGEQMSCDSKMNEDGDLMETSDGPAGSAEEKNPTLSTDSFEVKRKGYSESDRDKAISHGDVESGAGNRSDSSMNDDTDMNKAAKVALPD